MTIQPTAAPLAVDPPLADADAAIEPSEDAPVRLRLADGVRLLGRYEGAGYTDPRYLAIRADGQAVLLTRLLYLVATEADGRRFPDEIAESVSEQYGRRLGAAGVLALVTDKLGAAGLVVVDDAHGRSTAGAVVERGVGARADPVLALRPRMTLLPARAVGRIAGWLSVLFTPAVVVAVCIGLGVTDWWLIGVRGLGPALHSALTEPVLLLATLALILFSALFHECGHAAGCRYGGARPGVIGAGIYLVYPAFYTDVTDAYGLNRIGRLRTDLGGVYFNAVFCVAATGVYAATGIAPIAIAVLITHVAMLQQLLPVVRLDGYYILGDVAGLPNLFGYVGPILRSLRPRRPAHPRVAGLLIRTRVAVTIWVALIVPALTVVTAVFLWHAPEYVMTSATSAGRQLTAAGSAWRTGAIGAFVLAAFSLVALAVPMLGLVVVAARLATPVVRTVRRYAVRLPRPSRIPNDHFQETAMTATPEIDRSDSVPAGPPAAPPAGPPAAPPTGPPAVAELPQPRPVIELTAASFDEDTMLRRRTRPPQHGWRRSVFAVSGGRLNPGPSRVEVRERELAARVMAPIRGSRRVVVLSRKGGAGKTTTTLMLGHTFALERGDRVVALDANPDAGSLADRVARETDQTVTSLLLDRDRIERYADIRAYTSQAPTRLEIVASDNDPRISQALSETDYHEAVSLLDKHYNLVLLDTGTGILDSATQGILKEADQIVVVMPPALDGARVAAGTLDWLDQHGHRALVQSAVAVVNSVRGSGLVELDQVERHFAARCAATIRVPWDPILEAGAQAGVDELRPATRRAYLDLAAAVADGFSTPSPRC